MDCNWDLFRSFKVCSDAKEKVGCGKQREATTTYSIPGKTAALVPEFAVEDLPLAELLPRFLCLQWRTCPWAEHSDDDDDELNLFQIRMWESMCGVSISFIFFFYCMLKLFGIFPKKSCFSVRQCPAFGSFKMVTLHKFTCYWYLILCKTFNI